MTGVIKSFQSHTGLVRKIPAIQKQNENKITND